MPRLRKHQPDAPSVRLPDGAMARCLASHTGYGGWVERGDIVPLTHPNVARHLDCFEVFWRPGADSPFPLPEEVRRDAEEVAL